MLFNSIDFAVFLPVVFLLYWLVFRTVKSRNALIVLASYVFYGWWDWRFLSLLFASTVMDYFVGLMLGKEKVPQRRKMWLAVSLTLNLGLLGFFKYYDFFVDNFVQAFSLFGKELNPASLNIILPVGISFYTFQTLSYTIDVYRKAMKPTRDVVAFMAFVSFFPQLVAGPIERAPNLLPQFMTKKTFDYAAAVDGMRQILWGLFKKVVIADNCGVVADHIFNNSEQYTGAALFMGGVFFAFQIYGDFSGYSDMAIGTARLFGFKLMQNFAFPYFSRDIAEFWRRWHISLSTWFRDYLYIPLGGSRGKRSRVVRNVFIIFLVSGFWHGANWTFVVWGGLNALYFIPLLLRGKNRQNIGVIGAHGMPRVHEWAGMFITFFLTVIAWVFFRAHDLSHAVEYLASMAKGSIMKAGYVDAFNVFAYHFGFVMFVVTFLFLLTEWFGRRGQYALEGIATVHSALLRRGIYVLIAVTVFLLGQQEASFIYMIIR